MPQKRVPTGERALSYLCILLLGVAGAGCSRHSKTEEFERIAILRFENFGVDASADWMGRAFSEILTASLSTDPELYVVPSNRIHALERTVGARPVSAPGVSSERELAIIAGANRLAYGEYFVSGGRVHARVSIEVPATGKIVSVFSTSAPAGNMIEAAWDLSRQIWPQAPGYQTASSAALKAYVSALENTDPSAIGPSLDSAITADPDFGLPYLLLARTKNQAQDRLGALQVIDRALARNLKAPERARMELMAAELRGDALARYRSLQKLAQLEPSDPVIWRSMAEYQMATRNYAGAVESYKRSMGIEPHDIATLNQMGYASAYAGDFDTAVKTLGEYRTLRPKDANPEDSLGDIHLIAGRLREAEEFYLKADAKSPHFQQDGPLFKAAFARLMSGDLAGSESLAKRYLSSRAAENDPALGFRTAEWSWAAGRRQQAITQMETAAKEIENGPLRELAARAYAEAAIWRLALGDLAGAQVLAAKGMATAGPASAALARVAHFLAQNPAAPEEWSARARSGLYQSSEPNSFEQFAMAHALLLGGHYSEASNILKRLYERGSQVDIEGLPVLLAWADIETGNLKEAKALLRFDPIPPTAGTGPLFAFYFPHIFKLRATVAQREGDRAQAQANLELLRKLSGETPLVWEK